MSQNVTNVTNITQYILQSQSLTIAYTKEGKIQYGKDGIQYATKGSAGFDLKACGFDLTRLFLRMQTKGADDYESDINYYSYAPRESDVVEYNVTRQLLTLYSNSRILIKTGIKVAIPQGFCLQIVPRSGLALKHGITITNSPGIIDSDYRGEIGVILHNLGHEPFEIKPGDRIAQAVFVPVGRSEFQEITEEEFEQQKTERGVGGFGSTGV